VGSYVSPKKTIYLRKSPGGLKLNVVRPDENFQILDVKTLGLKNYYQVQKDGQRGYFYTGTLTVIDEWSSQTSEADYSPLPTKGDFIKVLTPYGTNLRLTPGGEKLSVARSEAVLEVLNTIFIQDTEKFYIKVSVDGLVGYLYTGKTNPYLTISDWVEVLE